MPSRQQQKHEYFPVGDEEVDNASPHHIRAREQSRFSTVVVLICLVVTIVSTSIGGFFAGRVYATKHISHTTHAVYAHTVKKSPVHLDPVTVKFTSNRAFLQHPSNETEELWKTLYPKDTHGLFEYPDENPERSGFAAFHQLHCVDAIRRGYYQREDTIEALQAGKPRPVFEHEVDEIHNLHCIEFLRQSIMCHADASIQTEAVYHQGIMAFGVEYQCRDWWQLVDWVNDRNEKFPPHNR